VIVRDATEEDWPELERIGRAFTKAAGMPDVDAASLQATLRMLMDSGILKVAVNGSVCGVAGAVLFPYYWNVRELVAQELFWYVDIDHRGGRAALMLLDAMERSARERGARKLMMLCLDELNPDGVERLYLRRGYKPQERTYAKELG